MAGWENNYYNYLLSMKSKDNNAESSSLQDSFFESVIDTPSHHKDAKKNGEEFPIIATRKEEKKCSADLFPGTSAFVGDTFYLYDENWICMEVHKDNYGLYHAELWLCNHLFKFTDHDGSVNQTWGIIDNGSYSSPSPDAIPLENAKLTCYISSSDKTNCLYIDKRIAIGTTYDRHGDMILSVGVISWLDCFVTNKSKGSHLIRFGLDAGVFDSSVDNVTEVVCDYAANSSAEEEHCVNAFIEGKDSIRIGTRRSYSLTVDDNTVISGVIWDASYIDGSVIAADYNGASLTIDIPLDENIVGQVVNISCRISETDIACTKEVEVIAYG